MSEVKSICRICSGFCGFKFEVEDGRITAYAPDKDHPISAGHACIKGNKGIEFAQGERGRIYETLVRQPDGRLEAIETKTALDRIAAQLRKLIDEHGPRSIALFFGTGIYSNTLGNIFSKAWLTAIGSPNLFTAMTIDQSAKWVTAGRMGVPLAGKRHPEELDVILISGSNPVISHYGFPSTPTYGTDPGRTLRAMKARGVKVIVIDPRRTETARLADLHLQLLPGTDATLYAGLIHVLFSAGLMDEPYLAANAVNVDLLRNLITDFDPDHVAAIAGVPADDIRLAAQWLGTAQSGQVGSGTGGCMGPDSNLADFLLEAINVLIGAYRRAGEVVRNIKPLAGVPAMDMILGPMRSWETAPKCRTQDVGKLFGEFPTGLLADEILTPGPDKIRAMIVIGGNPALSISDPEKTMSALADLELLVCVDPALNETGKMAHYVIPTTVSFERPELSAIEELFAAESRVTFYPPVQAPPAGMLHDWEFFWEIATRLGVDMEFKLATWGGEYSDLPPGLPLARDARPVPEELFAWLCERQGIAWSDVIAQPYGVVPPEAQHVLVGADTSARLDLCPDDVATGIHMLRHRPAPSDDGYRFRLAARRLLGNMNSAYRGSKGKLDINHAHIHPLDMAAEGIVADGRIWVTSDAGTIRAVAKPDPTMRRGVVSMGHCWGNPLAADGASFDGAAHTGRLIATGPNVSESINYTPRQTGIPINISSDPT